MIQFKTFVSQLFSLQAWKEKIKKNKSLSIFIAILLIFDIFTFSYFSETLPFSVLIPTFDEKPELKEITLYLPDQKLNRMIEEKRMFYPYKNNSLAVEAIIEELSSRPISLNARRAIPEGVEVRRIWILNNIAYIDFTENIRSIRLDNPDAEKFFIESIARSVLHNINTVSSIKFLVNGNETDVLWGGVDLTKPISFQSGKI